MWQLRLLLHQHLPQQPLEDAWIAFSSQHWCWQTARGRCLSAGNDSMKPISSTGRFVPLPLQSSSDLRARSQHPTPCWWRTPPKTTTAAKAAQSQRVVGRDRQCSLNHRGDRWCFWCAKEDPDGGK